MIHSQDAALLVDLDDLLHLSMHTLIRKEQWCIMHMRMSAYLPRDMLTCRRDGVDATLYGDLEGIKLPPPPPTPAGIVHTPA